MSDGFVPFLQYRGAVDPTTISVDLSSSEDEQEEAVFKADFKKKPGKRGKPATKHRKSPPNPQQQHPNRNLVVIDDDDDDDDGHTSNFNYEDEDVFISAPPPVEVTRKTLQAVPGFMEAMSAISQNKRLRNDIRKSADTVGISNDLDTSISADSPKKSDSVVFSISSADQPKPLKFRCLKNEPFQKLLGVYCSCRRIDSKSGVLKWYGITLEGQQTANDLGIEGDESLDFVPKQSSPQKPATPPTNNNNNNTNTNNNNNASASANTNNDNTNNNNSNDNKTPPQSGGPAPLPLPGENVVLKLRHGENTQKFRIRKTDPVRKLLDGYCSKNNLDPSKFSLTFDGLPLSLTATPEEHEMEDGDLIDVDM